MANHDAQCHIWHHTGCVLIFQDLTGYKFKFVSDLSNVAHQCIVDQTPYLCFFGGSLLLVAIFAVILAPIPANSTRPTLFMKPVIHWRQNGITVIGRPLFQSVHVKHFLIHLQ